MKKDKAQYQDIHERIFRYVLRVIKFNDKLNKTTTNLILINQVIRSATSIGANDQEADGAVSKKEFIHKYGIVRRESKETVYWLRLIQELNPFLKEECLGLINEGVEIVAIVSSIISNTKKGGA